MTTPLLHWRQRLPGLLLAGILAAGAVASGQVSWFAEHGVGALTLAIVFGMLAGNTFYPRIAPRFASGVAFAKSDLLRLGIILYGLRLTLQDIAQVGLRCVLIDALVLCSTFALAWLLGRRLFGLSRETTVLIGAGSSICGAAAIMAVEPVVRARSEEVSVAVATVVVFGTLAMCLYPLLAELNQVWPLIPGGERGFGIYIGSTLHEVAQVVAAGRAVGMAAADTAVITKMVRVMMLAPVLLGLSFCLQPGHDGRQGSRRLSIPWFALGFVAVVVLNSLQHLPEHLRHALLAADNVLLAMAMAALGLATHLSAVRQAGSKPLWLAMMLFGWLIGGGALINHLFG
jgi:uncharacterized integral membrane protein (TIGR00698 family)